MFLRRLYLHNFRNYNDAHLTFDPGINVIYGDNAQGKTNLLEAIHFLITGHSFRTSHMKDLIRHECPNFYLEAHFVKRGIDQKLRVTFDGKKSQVIYNNTTCPSLAHLLGLLQGVVITPDDGTLIKGSPQIRRQFLDFHITQLEPLYVHHLKRYHRAMAQRNHILRSRHLLSIESWEHVMAHAAAHITKQRLKTIEDLHAKSQVLHPLLNSEHEIVHLQYKSQAPVHDSEEILRQYYLNQFVKLRQREMDFGSTLTGPHKDDVLIFINDNEARFFASEGQQRGCIAALRLAEWSRIKSLSEESPILIIDDIGASLDDKRRKKIFDQLRTLGQVFISTTEALTKDADNPLDHHLRIHQGQVATEPIHQESFDRRR